MSRSYRFTTLVVLLALLISACAPVLPQAASPAPGRAEMAGPTIAQATLDAVMATEIERYIAEMMAGTGVPGLAIGVVQAGNLVYAQGFGVTNLDTGDPVTSRTLFQWAESAMAPSAIAVLQLAEQGLLDLDAPITDYLPYFRMQDATSAAITARHLLMHRSGVPDSGDMMADWENFMPERDAGAVERWVRSLSEVGLLFEPGTGFEYSDLGYSLLGAVAGAAAGRPFEEIVADGIFAPLAMDESTYLLENVDKSLLAAPHIVNSADEVVASSIQPYHRPFGPANNLFSSIEDMAKLVEAMLNHGTLDGQTILTDTSVDSMWEDTTPSPYADFPFGVDHPSTMMMEWGSGWFLGEVAGHRVPNTFGREHGYHSAIALAPDAGLAIMVAGNGPVQDRYYASDTATDVLAMLLGASAGDVGEIPSLEPAMVTEIETLVAETLARGQVPGAAVGIIKDGALVYAQGFGVTELGGTQPVTPETIFIMASVSKSFVGIAVMQLVEAGKVDLDAPVTAYLPYFDLVDDGEVAVTVRQVLGHVSGLPDDKARDYENGPTDAGALEAYVRGLTDQSLLFPPGEGWYYSDMGYNVLGDLIAKVSGMTFEEYMTSFILAPLDMRDSTFLKADVDLARLAQPATYDETGAAVPSPLIPYLRANAPAGALYSTVEDMARFALANMNYGTLDGAKILDAATYPEMWEQRYASPWAQMFGSALSHYGLGWWCGDFADSPVMGNYGAMTGYQTHLALFPEDGVAVIVLTNLYDEEVPSFPALEIGNAISALLLGVDPTSE